MNIQQHNGTRLTEEAVNHYRAFGFLVFREMISNEEIQSLSAEVSGKMRQEYPEMPERLTESDHRQWALMMDGDTPAHSRLLEDPRFLNPARQLCGHDLIGIKAQSNVFGGDTPWHRDTFTSDRGGLKFIWYYTSLTGETGALRIVPVTHQLGDNYLFKEKLLRLPPESVPASSVETAPGDVIAFDMRVWHGSFGGQNRMESSLTYYNNPKTSDEEEALRLRAFTNIEILLREYGPRRDYFYSREWLSNPDANEHRSRWIHRLQEVGFFDAPGLVEGGYPSDVFRAGSS